MWSLLLQSALAVPHNPVVHYAFDGSGSTTADSLGTGPDLVLSDCTQNQGGLLGNVTGADWGTNLRCNSSASEVVGTDDPLFDPPELSIAAWFRINNLPSCNGVCSLVAKHRRGAAPGGYWLSVTSGRVRLTVADGSGDFALDSPNPYVPGDWVHVVATIEGQTLTLYENGVQVAQQDAGFTWVPEPTPFRLASLPNAGTGLVGRLEELTLFDAALDAGQAADVYDFYIDDDGDGWAGDDDCDDGNDAVFVGAVEVCNGIDDNCQSGIDEGLLSDWYLDADLDGFGAGPVVQACDPPSGHVADGSDCDDNDSDISPSGQEVCDAADADEDCDGLADDADADVLGQEARYPDADSDGFGEAGALAVQTCEIAGTAAEATDCDDTDAAVNPLATEVCDPLDVDEDCNGLADDADPGTALASLFLDGDGDGFGGQAIQSCDGVQVDGDCDDTRPDVNPAALEVWYDGTDQDCDGNDADRDLDGALGGPGGEDCDDDDDRIFPSANEKPDDGVDQNCDGEDGIYLYGNGGCGCTAAPRSLGGAFWAFARRR